jgi:thiol-disulfide isomerase/thioredoxin
MRTLIYIVLFTLLPLKPAAAASLPAGIIELEKVPATDFTISDYDGKQYSLDQSRGKWVFLHFWASWCGPCRKEMPTIANLKTLMADKPIDIILINTAEDEDTIFSFLGAVAPSLKSYMDRKGELTEQWAPRGLPTTFFIDPQGNRRYLALGGRPWDRSDYQDFINRLLKEKQNQ